MKCQKPIETNMDPLVLVYNQRRDFEVFLPYDEQWKELFGVFGLTGFRRAKFFAEAHLDGQGLVIDRPLETDLGW